MKEATARKVNGGTEPDTLRHPLAALQGRLDALESEARGRLKRALGASNDALLELDVALERLSREDWTATGVRRHLEMLRARADNLRTAALRRVAEMPGEAVSRLATGSRVPVQNLARGLQRIAKRLEPPPRPEPLDESVLDEVRPVPPEHLE